MKGKELSYEEIIKLPHLTTVWEDSDYFTGKCKVNQEGKFITEDEVTINMGGWTFDELANKKEVQDSHISIYEWIEDKPTYTGSEILYMIENGELKDDDIIIDRENDEYSVKGIKNYEHGNTVSCFILIKYSPFTIKKRNPVDFMTAFNSHKLVKPSIGEYEFSHMNDYLEVIQNSSVERADQLINGLWYIK